MEKNIFAFIYRYSKRQQLIVLVFTLISFPFLYLSLDLPKNIIDQAIGGSIDFPTDFFALDFVGFPGFALEQVPYLFTLCGLYLLLVVVNGAFKYYLNIYRGRLGEQMLRRLRYTLFTRVLRFRLPQFKRMSQGEIIPMVTAEVEPLGGYVADAFALPAYQGGTLLVYLVFIFIQDPILGAAAIALYPVQAVIIPRLQSKVNALGKQRVRTMRHLSDRIGETISNAEAVHANNTARLHLSEISSILGTVYKIRYEIFQRKFFIKFLNNFLNQLTPFFFYSVGGYLVLQGNLSFGSLVAVLAAYKDLAGPWRELLNYYQRTEDARIKYDQVVEQFQPDDLMPDEQISGEEGLEGDLPAAFTFSSVSFAEEDRPPILSALSFDVPTDKRVAILGNSSSGRLEFMQLLARLLIPTSGRIRLGTHDWAQLPEAVTGRRITYVGPQPFLFSETVESNLIYGLKHDTIDANEDQPPSAERKRDIADALAAGNIDLDFHGDWIDFEEMGLSGAGALRERLIEVLSTVGLDEDIYRMGLGGTIDPYREVDLAEQVLRVREAVADRLMDDEYVELVERFDFEKFNESATVAENLLFGTPVGQTFESDSLAQNEHMLAVLEAVGLKDRFLAIGISVAETMIELFADLPPGHPFFEQFSFISSDELPEFQPLLLKASGKDGHARLEPEEKARFMALSFLLVPGQHRLGMIEEDERTKILEARRRFADTLPDDMKGAVEFFSSEKYNAAATLQDNILFGKVRYGQADGADKVSNLITEVVTELNLRGTVIEAGLENPVGVGGSRLSAQQRQKVALARALLKNPDVLILSEATGSLDAVEQERIVEKLLALREGKGLIWAPEDPEMARGFDEVLLLKDGRLAGRGDFDSLDT